MAGESDIVGTGWAFPLGVNSAGGISLVAGSTDIQQAIGIILSTSPGERVMRPAFGCRVHELIFAPSTDDTLNLARQYVEEALGMWEPRIEVVEVDAEFNRLDLRVMEIEVSYLVRGTKDERTLVYPFYLIEEVPAVVEAS